MAQKIFGSNDQSYKGLASIFEYTNYDGVLQAWNCGQAAIATLLTALEVFDVSQARETMSWLEKHYPPDVLWGWLGTSKKQVIKACKHFGVYLKEAKSADLFREMKLGNPAILMVGVSAGRVLGIDLPGGHWTVAYGFDTTGIYLTNWGDIRCPWDDFTWRWKSMVSRFIGMGRTGLVVDSTLTSFV